MIASGGRSQFGLAVKTRKCSARCAIALVILFSASSGHLCFAASDREYELIPIRDGKDLTRGNRRVLVTAPKGWELVRVPIA